MVTHECLVKGRLRGRGKREAEWGRWRIEGDGICISSRGVWRGLDEVYNGPALAAE